MLTPRENLLRIFRHERPEWIPVCGHMDPYNQPSREGMDPALAQALGTVEWCDESTLTFSRHLGLDFMDYVTETASVTRRAVTVETATTGDDTLTTWHTPAGDLRQISRQCREDGTSYLVEHMVKGPDDLPALAAIFEDEVLTPDPRRVEEIRRKRALIGEDGILIAFLSGTPMGMMYREYCGVEMLAYLHADVPDAMRDLYAVMERNYQRRFAITAETGVDALVGMDDTSTTVISPAMFEEFNLGLTDARTALCHARGKLYFHHSCGLIRDLLTLYRRTAMDAVHGYTTPPTGNVTVAQGRPLLGDRITIIAAVEAMAEQGWHPDRMRADIRRLFADAPGDHFVLVLPGYPHRTMAQTQAIVDECRKYQKKG